jgi:preprotein translocase subunit SecD
MAMLADTAARSALQPGYEWAWGGEPQTFTDGRSYKTLYLVNSEALMTGEAVATASAGFDPQAASQPIVTLDLTSEGATQFGDVTRAHVNQRLAIVLDQVVRMAPNIRQPIMTGSAQIEGFDSVQEARDIAIVLRAGALPAPLEVIEERTVGPSLGADSINAGKVAGTVGLLMVMGFMAFYYRGAGLIADIGLILNIVLVLAALAAFGATLTLPGIAGLILTVGMAVDANVLVFERVREELALGKTVRAAVDAGYDRAFVTILDAQITTLIAAAVLFQFGTGPIKGFAVVLTIGIVCSIFTAVFVTRTIFDTWTRRSSATRLSI